MATRGRLKKGNIFLFLMLILGLVYYFNQDAINRYLEEQQFVVNNNVNVDADNDTQVSDNPPPPSPEPVTPPPPTSTEEVGEVVDIREEVGEPWDVLSQHGDTLYTNQQNLIQIRVAEIDVNDVVPIPDFEAKDANVVAVDRNTGKYNISKSNAGKLNITLMGKRDGKLDVIGEKTFVVINGKTTPTNNDYLWMIKTPRKNTLLADKPNIIQVLVSEIAPQNIRLKISGVNKGNNISPEDIEDGIYKIILQDTAPVTLNILLHKKGKLSPIGSQTFKVVGQPIKTTIAATTNKNAGKTNGNSRLLDIGKASKISLSSSEFAKLRGVQLPILNTNNINFTLKHYSKSSNPQSHNNKGYLFDAESRQLLLKAKSKDWYQIVNIKAIKGNKTLSSPNVVIEVE